MEDTLKNLIGQDKLNLTDEKTKIIEFFNNDDYFMKIFKKKMIICKLRNSTEQNGGKNIDIPNRNLYIQNLDKERLLLLSKLYFKTHNTTSFADLEMRINIILNKYKFKNNHKTFFIKPLDINSMTAAYYSYIKKHSFTYINTIPANKKFKNLLLHIPFTFSMFINKFDYIEKYINFIIINCIKNNGNLIISTVLPCSDNINKTNYINLINNICKNFKKVDLVLVKNLKLVTPLGFIILKKKVATNNLNIDNNIKNKINKFINKVDDFTYNAGIMTNNLIKFELHTSKEELSFLINKLKYNFK